MSEPRDEAVAARTRRPPVKAKVTRSLALLLICVAFAAGLVLGWVGRGGPADPVLVTTGQDIPAVTITQEAPAP